MNLVDMKLSQLKLVLSGADELNFHDLEIEGIANDSRKVRDGSLFVAVRGQTVDGHDFIPAAIEKGAAAIVTERKVNHISAVPQFVVEDARHALAELSNEFFLRPSHKISCIGITGTNGKTTTTHLLKAILEEAGENVGLLGTIRYAFGRRQIPAAVTTPESVDLQRFLAEMVDENISYAVMEVSSHALDQRRVDAVEFKAAVLTNFGSEHLDYHGDIETYRNAKSKFFEKLNKNCLAVLNADDAASEHFAAKTDARLVWYGMKDKRANITGRVESMELEGTSFRLCSPSGEITVRSSLIGEHNVYNMLCAAATAEAFGIDLETIARGLGHVLQVPGRLERVDCGQDFLLMVDYAHTDHALQAVLGTLRPLVKGRIIVVFGCGGDRDTGKRPRMARVVEELADVSWVTSDNPRTEDPEGIIRDITAGFSRKSTHKVCLDRREAISEAISEARAGDLLLIAGKGHETYQVLSDTVIPFDDRIVASEIIKEGGSSKG